MGVNVAGARVAQREVRVTDVHDGEGVRHRRRRLSFANSERLRLLSLELHCGANCLQQDSSEYNP